MSLTINYDWKRLFVGTVPANFCHWWALSLLTVVSYNSEPWNYDWKRLFVGTINQSIILFPKDQHRSDIIEWDKYRDVFLGHPVHETITLFHGYTESDL